MGVVYCGQWTFPPHFLLEVAPEIDTNPTTIEILHNHRDHQELIKYKQLSVSGTGVFSFCNLLYIKHISGIFVHLTIRAYRRMVGKDNQKYDYQYRYRHRRYF